MKFSACGGFGEHGRNCFLVAFHTEETKEGLRVLVDCGIMEGDPDPLPRLLPDRIPDIDYVFLTHSHKDHSGALGWLAEHGLRAPVYMTGETRRQLETDYRDIRLIDGPEMELTTDEDGHRNLHPRPGFAVSWGRSGHCSGSVWLHMSTGDESVFFSGDYQEDTLANARDPVRNMRADLAVIDAAYGADPDGAGEKREALLSFIREQMQAGKPLLLPVPKVGRGLELFYLLSAQMPEIPVYVGSYLRGELERMAGDGFWMKPGARQAFGSMLDGRKMPPDRTGASTPFIRIVADPHLKQPKYQQMAKEILSGNGVVLLTGKANEGSFAETLLNRGMAVRRPYPHHQNNDEAERLCEANDFRTALFYHNDQQMIYSSGRS